MTRLRPPLFELYEWIVLVLFLVAMLFWAASCAPLQINDRYYRMDVAKFKWNCLSLLYWETWAKGDDDEEETHQDGDRSEAVDQGQKEWPLKAVE